jgi:hypothetical protein
MFVDYGKRLADDRRGDTPRESREKQNKGIKLQH